MFSFKFRNFIFFFNTVDDYGRAYEIMESIQDDDCLSLFDWLDINSIHFKAIEVEPTELGGDENA